jgi:hypothetical protein
MITQPSVRWVLALTGTAATVVAGAIFMTEMARARAPQVPPLSFEGGRLIVAETLRTGLEYDVPVVLINDGDEPARVIGFLEGCGSQCYKARGLPVTVPPKGRESVIVHISAYAAGPFEEQILFYTDRPSHPTLTLTVQGITEESTDENNAGDNASE